MDRYQRVERPKAETSIDENEIRITSQGRMRNYITYAMSLLQEKGLEVIVFKAMGRAINKTVTIVELIKRRIADLHQNTSIGSNDITDLWEPLEEGLFPLETTRHVSMITITLSKKELNVSSVGYQTPIPADQVKASGDFDYEGEGSPSGRGRGRGGRGRGRARGRDFVYVDHEDRIWDDNRGNGRDRGRGRGRNFLGRGRGGGYNGPQFDRQQDLGGGYNQDGPVRGRFDRQQQDGGGYNQDAPVRRRGGYNYRPQQQQQQHDGDGYNQDAPPARRRGGYNGPQFDGYNQESPSRGRGRGRGNRGRGGNGGRVIETVY